MIYTETGLAGQQPQLHSTAGPASFTSGSGNSVMNSVMRTDVICCCSSEVCAACTKLVLTLAFRTCSPSSDNSGIHTYSRSWTTFYAVLWVVTSAQHVAEAACCQTTQSNRKQRRQYDVSLGLCKEKLMSIAVASRNSNRHLSFQRLTGST